ncbi:hypothetical protein CI1B_47580 [Bradyrhizobium ivorense]|uniref:DUF1236 domain-containing protein n=1 Tax=Bradyrhizobium ivorense TaxID=2511166 RepID=A0A508TFL7_9BRAD|nr:DUF1236 domain-containing protein [Bradyrhizobium ivorense]MCC8936280.1 DUF1236 domain-containing protein [Bradyrhizobium ivorense]VIO67829.1 hypothetical protein CI41S_12010 [Bradyrhizobium ivorense]VIO73154.1 hypothetical protein CI1B_47580 [Bradyrhizobium ivorense]
MNKRLLTAALAEMIATGAMAQSTVVSTTGTGHAAAVQIEPEDRTKIRTHVTEHKVRPVETREKIVVGQRVPREVELEAVPTDWGPSLTKYRYVYSGERVMLVDPSTRTVVSRLIPPAAVC